MSNKNKPLDVHIIYYASPIGICLTELWKSYKMHSRHQLPGYTKRLPNQFQTAKFWHLEPTNILLKHQW